MSLFQTGLPLRWLPDETLFSLCSRFHRLSGNHLAATTCRLLFGHPTQGSAHDFPSRIDHFVEATDGALGSAEEIIRQRTILPFYFPFSTSDLAATAISAMAGSSIGSLKFQLGLLTSRFRANHPLKACRACMAEDEVEHMTPYWHRDHQLPGAWACRQHRTWLTPSTVKATGVGRFLWALPDDRHLRPQRVSTPPSPGILALSQSAVALASLDSGQHFESDAVRATYRYALHARGLLSGHGKARMNLKAIGSEYQAHVAALRSVDELAALPSDCHSAAAEVGRLLYAYRSGTHPIRHLALIAWLFPDLAAFITTYQCAPSLGRAAATPPSERPPRTAAAEPQARQLELFTLLATGRSVSSAARQIGVAPATGMAWAAAAGIPTDKRPSLIKGEVKAAMVAALKRGASKTVVATIGGVSVVSVTRLLRTEVGLRERWRSAQFLDAQRLARKIWLRAAGANPHAGVKAARALQPAAYAWLYRNDRAWLDEQAGRMERASREGGLRIDWDARDADIAAEVRRAALEIAVDGQRTKIKLWQLYQRLPELKAKLSRLDRLPLTLSAVYAATRAEPINDDHLPSPSAAG